MSRHTCVVCALGALMPIGHVLGLPTDYTLVAVFMEGVLRGAAARAALCPNHAEIATQCADYVEQHGPKPELAS